MNTKLIKIEDHFYVVDYGEIKIGVPDREYFNTYDNNIWTYRPSSCPLPFWGNLDTLREITHSTQQLDGVILLDLTDIEEVVNGYSLEKMSEHSSEVQEATYTIQHKITYKHGYKDGFNACQKLNKNKLFTTDDIQDALLQYGDYIFNKHKGTFTSGDLEFVKKRIIESIYPKTVWDIEIDENNKIKLI